MGSDSPRILREKRTIAVMIAMYCRGRHGSGSLCAECQELHEYAFARLDRCRFGSGKPPCANCTVHCYKPSMREKARAVMRYAGPRMLWLHPILSLRHWLDSFRRK